MAGHPCKKCAIADCNFRGRHTPAAGELRDNPHVRQDYRVCKFYRCPGGVRQALVNIRNAARGGMQWERREVYDPKTGKSARMPVLDATTYFKDRAGGQIKVLKEGFITPELEWVAIHEGRLQKTGQLLEPKSLFKDKATILNRVRQGLESSGLQ